MEPDRSKKFEKISPGLCFSAAVKGRCFSWRRSSGLKFFQVFPKRLSEPGKLGEGGEGAKGPKERAGSPQEAPKAPGKEARENPSGRIKHGT